MIKVSSGRKTIHQVTVCLLFLFTAIQLAGTVGCHHPSEQNTSSKVSESKQPATLEQKSQEIVPLVETFAEDVGEVGQTAWNKLQLYPRKELVDYLLQLQDSKPSDDSLIPRIAFVLCNFDYEYDHNKAAIMSALTRSNKYQRFYADNAASMIARLIARGDKQLLNALFAAANWSDAALSEGLADTFGTEMLTHPRAFLTQLVAEPKATRQRVYRLLYEPGMPVAQLNDTRNYLLSIPPNSDVTQIAREMIEAIRKVKSKA